MAGTAVNVKRAWGLGTTTWPDPIKAIIDEHNNVITDLETLRGVLQAGGVTLVNEMRDDISAGADNYQAWCTEVDSDLDDINDYLSFQGEQDGVIGGNYTWATQAAADFLGAGSVMYRIGGEVYYPEMQAAIAPDDGGVTAITGSNFFACRVVIDRLGVVTTERVDGAGQATAEAALLHLGSVAQAANTAVLGYITLQASTGYTPGTDNVNGEGAAVFYYERQPKNQASALTAAMGSALTASGAVTTLNVGTADIKRNGLRMAQIAANATLALTDADTIADGQTGGIMLLSNLAGTGFVTLSSDGVPGVSAIADTDAAGALTALNLLASRLPSMFVPLGYIIVTMSGAAFTAGTTQWNNASLTVVAVDQSFGVHDRTVAAASFLARESNPPAVPATVTANVPAALASAAASATAVDAAGDLVAATITTQESGD